MKNYYRLLPILTGLVALTSCQFNYTFPEPTQPDKNFHGAHGCAYKAGMEACFLAASQPVDEMTDEELHDATEYPSYPGQGYSDSEWYGENAPLISASQYFDCEDGTGLLLTDEGDIIEVKLHFFEGENGVKYIFDDETGELVYFDFSVENS